MSEGIRKIILSRLNRLAMPLHSSSSSGHGLGSLTLLALLERIGGSEVTAQRIVLLDLINPDLMESNIHKHTGTLPIAITYNPVLRGEGLVYETQMSDDSR